MEKRVLKIQEHLRNFGLEATVDKFKLKTKSYKHKTLFKYDQLISPTMMALPEIQECRGLILENGTWDVFSMAFEKFFNSEESNAHKIDWNTAQVLEKLDGCCYEDTIIITEDGEMTIREICETNYSGKVLSFDLELNELVYDEIVDYSIKKNINNWFEIELEDGTMIKLTGNHKVWLPKLNCYRRVDELTDNDEFLLITK
jgi:hypothetical protein